MGLVEVLPRAAPPAPPAGEAAADIARRRPDVVVTIDSPGFTLRLLRAIAALGIPRVHYVAPQVWAWREHRVREFPGAVGASCCACCRSSRRFLPRHGLPASFVGHPVLESGADRGDAARFRARHGLGRRRRCWC